MKHSHIFVATYGHESQKEMVFYCSFSPDLYPSTPPTEELIQYVEKNYQERIKKLLKYNRKNRENRRRHLYSDIMKGNSHPYICDVQCITKKYGQWKEGLKTGQSVVFL